jgi:hypothetical protein
LQNDTRRPKTSSNENASCTYVNWVEIGEREREKKKFRTFFCRKNCFFIWNVRFGKCRISQLSQFSSFTCSSNLTPGRIFFSSLGFNLILSSLQNYFALLGSNVKYSTQVKNDVSVSFLFFKLKNTNMYICKNINKPYKYICKIFKAGENDVPVYFLFFKFKKYHSRYILKGFDLATHLQSSRWQAETMSLCRPRRQVNCITFICQRNILIVIVVDKGDECS